MSRLPWAAGVFSGDAEVVLGATREDFTMGASFGAERELAFRHVASGVQFAFPQRNGDVFAFNSNANAAFEHGVPALRGGAARATNPSERRARRPT